VLAKAAQGKTAQGKYDVVVVGGGAAGLSGALTLGRALRSVLVIDAGTPRNAPAGHVYNYTTTWPGMASPPATCWPPAVPR
jgi:thioredoxin reductase